MVGGIVSEIGARHGLVRFLPQVDSHEPDPGAQGALCHGFIAIGPLSYRLTGTLLVERVSPPRSLWMRLRAPSLQGPNSRADRRAAATRRTVIGPAAGAAYWDHRSRR